MKKNIGLFLSAEPNHGGVYQYSLSMIRALETLDPDRYNLRCFYSDQSWEPMLPQRFQKNWIKKKNINRGLGYITKKLISSPAGWRLAGMFNDAVKAINSSDCDVVIYPSQDGQAYQTNKKSIATIHDLMHRYEPQFDEYKGNVRARRDINYSAMCRYSNFILTDSKIGKQQVIKSYKVDESTVGVLPFVPPFYLLEAQFQDIKKKYSLPEKFIFYPAQFWEHKNHATLLMAVKLLLEELSDVHLVLVGSKKNNYSKISKMVENLGLDKHVSILGYVSNDEMYSLYKSAVAMTFVSLIGPTNIPPMEALVTGCPLVCSNVYAMPEQVGDAALLVDPKDAFDIASKIKLVWNDAVIRNRLIASGLQHANKYGQDDFAKRLSQYVDQVVSSE